MRTAARRGVHGCGGRRTGQVSCERSPNRVQTDDVPMRVPSETAETWEAPGPVRRLRHAEFRGQGGCTVGALPHVGPHRGRASALFPVPSSGARTPGAIEGGEA